MAVFRGTIRSKSLSMDTGLNVILPYDQPTANQQAPCKVLYLLHGLGDNCDAWCRYTAIELYAREKGIAVVMPEVQRSFYMDLAYGIRYFTYVAEELPELCARMFRISTAREDTFIAGLSMGSHGALKCAFTYPERYAGCGSFSGAGELAQVIADHANDTNIKEFWAALGTDLHIQDKDKLQYLAAQVSKLPGDEQPAVFFTCGQQDFLYEQNLKMKRYLEELPLHSFVYREWPGIHEWPFWNESIRQALDFFLPHQG